MGTYTQDGQILYSGFQPDGSYREESAVERDARILQNSGYAGTGRSASGFDMRPPPPPEVLILPSLISPPKKAPATPKGPSDFQKAAKDFRKTAAGIQLGKKLFSKDYYKISPAQIVSLLRAAGVDVPKNVAITADVAQLIMAGGVITSKIEMGASIGSYADSTAIACAAAFELMKECGLIDPNSPLVDALTLGIDIVLVVSSYGANVVADIKLIVDIITIAGDHPDVVGQAKAIANKNLNDYIWGRKKSQFDALSKNFVDYQEGKHNLFAMMGLIAEESPDFFYNYFPDAKVFIPPAILEIKYGVTSSADTLFGGHTEGYAEALADILTVRDNSHAALANNLFNEFVTQHLDIYRTQAFAYDNGNKIPITDLMILSMLPPYTQNIPEGFKLSQLLKAQFLTPNDLDSNILSDLSIQNSVMHQPAFTLNGVEYTGGPSQVDLTKQSVEDKKIVRADSNGNINSLLKIPRAKDKMDDWGNIQFIPGYPMLRNKVYTQQVSKKAFFTRNLRNFWSALSILEAFRTDSYFQDQKDNFARYEWIPQMKDIEEKHQKLQFLSTARHMNAQAYKNIASFLGTDTSKLKLLRKGSPGVPAIFDT